MRRSLRSWLVLVSAAVSVAFIGSVAVTGYLVVASGLIHAAEKTATDIAHSASHRLKQQVTQAKLDAALAGLSGADREREAKRRVLREIPDMFESGEAALGDFALYAEGTETYWFSDERALLDHEEHRLTALSQRRSLSIERSDHHPLRGLFGHADLGEFIIHVPLDLPEGNRAVLDVVYDASREERIIDSLRLPMLALAFTTFTLSVGLMRGGVSWILHRLEELRLAADSIDAGDFEVRLPDFGENEIGDLSRSLNRLIGRLGQQASAQTRFVADASHELATPVAGIRGYVNILKGWGLDDPELRDEAVRAIDRESRRMARLTGDLLALIRSGKLDDYRWERFDLNARCLEVLESASARYREKSLQLVGPGKGPLHVVGDPERLEDAVSILVDNAAKYTPPGGVVELATRRRREEIVIDVVDSGPGISPDELETIFERFYRADASRSKQTGFGLGLPIAKSIVEASGGALEVRSTVGAGSTFTIRLPVVRP